MKRFLCALIVVSALVAALPGVARAAADCAFEDVNDNGVFDAGDAIVTDAQWVGGTAFVTNHPFVVPAGCVIDILTLKAPLFGVKVTATKITFLGTLTYIPAGGKGVVLTADPSKVPAPGLGDGSITVGDGITSNVKIEAGGFNDLPSSTIAVYRKSIALIAAGECSINNASLIGNRPIQDTRVGVLCNNDMTIRQGFIKGSRVNIQSLTGKIDARSFAPPAPVNKNLALSCDDPAINVVGGAGAPGNGNGVLDAGDFPCQLNLAAISPSPIFNNAGELAAFCLDPALAGGVNIFQAFNDPLIMIAFNDLDLRGVQGGETQLLGRYRVTLGSEEGNINTAHTFINHGPQPVPGGARIAMFANPASINRLPVDFEDFFGPSTGTYDITSSCFESSNAVRVGDDGDATLADQVIGTPDGPPCKQFPADFVPVVNGIF